MTSERNWHQEATVDDSLETLKAELERFGETNDAATTERPRRMLNITRDTGEFLAVLVRATIARRVLEIGTSNGYSTLWLADAARKIGGLVTTVEFAEYKIELASANLRALWAFVVHHAGSRRRGSLPATNRSERIRRDLPRFRPPGVSWLVASPAASSTSGRLVDRGQRDVSRGTNGSLRCTGDG